MAWGEEYSVGGLPKWKEAIPKVVEGAKRGLSRPEFMRKLNPNILKFPKAEVLKQLKNQEMIRRMNMLKNVKGMAGGNILGVAGAASGGWSLGRMLGQTPLIADPNMTYDQFYQNMFQNILGRR